MELNKLRQFILVADTENITKAANKLFISQPALSQTIIKIEEELGVNLFDRIGKSIYLNENGMILYKYAKEVIQGYEQLQADLNKDYSQTYIKFCYTNNFFPKYILNQFIAERGNAHLSINTYSNDFVDADLIKKKFDIAISNQCIHSRNVRNMLFLKNSVFVSVPENNKLAQYSSLYLKNFQYEKFIRLETGGEFTASVNALIKNEQLKIPAYHIGTKESVDLLKMRTDYLYFITSLQIHFDKHPTGRKFIKLNDVALTQNIYISYLSDNPLAKEFISWIKNNYINIFKNSELYNKNQNSAKRS